jgi:polyketide cyclase/dehydrase/lipid transport protein
MASVTKKLEGDSRRTLVAEATAIVQASASQVLGFVLDLDRYRQADHKIRRVRHLEQQGDDILVSMWTRFRGLPVAVTQRMHLTPGVRIDVYNQPSWQDRFVTFHGEFLCLASGSGTQVTHRYTFNFSRLAGVVRPLLERWILQDIQQEVERLKAILERGVAAPE